MCGIPYTDKKDAAELLAEILNGRDPMDAEDVRRLIRMRWDELKSLAHKVHEEEVSEEKTLDRAIRQLCSLDKDGIVNVIKRTANSDVIEACKLVAKKILQH